MTNEMHIDANPPKRICQGDIFQNVEFIEYVRETDGVIEVSKIIFPLVVVLTQDCDLERDHAIRSVEAGSGIQDKLLLSVLVAPLCNAEHVYEGKQLSDLGISSTLINKGRTPGNMLRSNKNPRYHYLQFPAAVPIVSSIVDFKRYFSVNVEYLRGKEKDRICKLAELYREDISQRFASFLSRIGLP